MAVLLPVIASVLFLIECAVFHYSLLVGMDALALAAITLLPGLAVLLALKRYAGIDLSKHEVLSLASSVGIGTVLLILCLLRVTGLPTVAIYFILIGIGVIGSASYFRHRTDTLAGSWKSWAELLNDLWKCVIFALVLIGAYSLPQFHFTSDGAILTHALFGVDIPFLAGEVHGIRNFGSLHDLHQAAQPWHYHDAIYQLLSLLPRDRTLEDLAFAAPLVGYSLLGFSLFTLIVRFTKNRVVGSAAVAVWFLVSGISGTELGSYALSPSFVFGSLVALNLLLLLDVRSNPAMNRELRRRREGTVLSILILVLFAELTETKVSTFLAFAGATILLSVWLLRRDRILAAELLTVLALCFAIVIIQSLPANPLMPGGDFLIGAPLMGYGNHLAAALHLPVASLNPVSQGLHVALRSWLLVPYSIFHLLRWAILDPKIFTSLILMAAMNRKWYRSGVSQEVRFVLFSLLPIGLLLPVAYSPAWYPLALSFYAPLISTQAALILISITLPVIWSSERTFRSKVTLVVGGIALIMGFARTAQNTIRDCNSNPRVVKAGLVLGLKELAKIDENQTVLASRRFDLDTSGDESYYWYAAISGHPVLSEGAKYGSLLGAVSDTNSEKGLHPTLAAQRLLGERRELLDTVFVSSDARAVRNAISKGTIRYVIQETGKSQAPIWPANGIGRIVFHDSEVCIWKVR